jgi:AcrR family transcriptional regulator
MKNAILSGPSEGQRAWNGPKRGSLDDHSPPKPKKSATKDSAHWHRRPEARRQEILDAALAVFAEKGFSMARMEEIAKRAGITSGTPYLYFAGKEEIFKTLVEESIGPRVLELARVAREFEGSSADLIRLVIRAIDVFLRSSNRAVLPKLIIAETGNFPELARLYRSQVTDRILGIFEGIIHRGVTRGEFREIDARHGARLVFVPAMFTAIWCASFGTLDSEPYDYEGFIETHLDILLRGLAADEGARQRQLETITTH